MSAPRTYPQALDTHRYIHTHTPLTLTVLILNRKPGKPKRDGITQSLLWYKRLWVESARTKDLPLNWYCTYTYINAATMKAIVEKQHLSWVAAKQVKPTLKVLMDFF